MTDVQIWAELNKDEYLSKEYYNRLIDITPLSSRLADGEIHNAWLYHWHPRAALARRLWLMMFMFVSSEKASDDGQWYTNTQAAWRNDCITNLRSARYCGRRPQNNGIDHLPGTQLRQPQDSRWHKQLGYHDTIILQSPNWNRWCSHQHLVSTKTSVTAGICRANSLPKCLMMSEGGGWRRSITIDFIY